MVDGKILYKCIQSGTAFAVGSIAAFSPGEIDRRGLQQFFEELSPEEERPFVERFNSRTADAVTPEAKTRDAVAPKTRG
jgi:hypothetical protein